MEISPIAGIRALPIMKALPADYGLSPVFDMESLAKIGDETYSPSGGKSAGGREDEWDDLEDEAALSRARAMEEGQGRQISYFA
jgi:hypothetical protein